MKKTLYQQKLMGENNKLILHIQINAYFNEDCALLITGYDSGSITKSILGSFDYEYYLTITSSEVKKLKKILNQESDDELLNYFETHFSNEKAVDQIKEMYKTNAIEYDFSVWR